MPMEHMGTCWVCLVAEIWKQSDSAQLKVKKKDKDNQCYRTKTVK